MQKTQLLTNFYKTRNVQMNRHSPKELTVEPTKLAEITLLRLQAHTTACYFTPYGCLLSGKPSGDSDQNGEKTDTCSETGNCSIVSCIQQFYKKLKTAHWTFRPLAPARPDQVTRPFWLLVVQRMPAVQASSFCGSEITQQAGLQPQVSAGTLTPSCP